MNDVMHDLLNKLRVISKVKEYQKLDTTHGLNVYTEGVVNWILRKWNRDTKNESVRYLRDLFKSLQQAVETLIIDSKQLTDNKKHNTYYILVNVATELKSSIYGLDNLCKTYANFPATTAAIDGIIKDYVIVIYASLIETIPTDILTKDLRESITYGGLVIYSL